MAEHDPVEAIEYELEEGRAYALGQAGKRVEAAITALEAQRGDREQLLDDAADAVWAYLIIREGAGFFRHDEAYALYRIPPAVRARVGIIKKR